MWSESDNRVKGIAWAIEQMEAEGKEDQKVDHPSHYNTGKFEAIEVIEDWKLGFNLGNTIKYLSRAGKKDPAKHLEDLEKAAWYLKREIDNLKNNK